MQIVTKTHDTASMRVEVQYSLKLDISKVAQAGSEGSKSLAELLYGKAL